MKAKTLGAALLALGLAGCGGKQSFTINGTLLDANGNVTNIRNAGLVLANGDDQISVPVGASTFSFPKQIEYGDTYTVVVKKQPDHMTCAPESQTGTAGRTQSINLGLTCTQNSYAVIITIKGLTGTGLQLINGSTSTVNVGATETTKQFSGIPVGVSYGITISQQPQGQTCDIVNGTGIMGDADRADAVVTCVKNP